LNPATPTSGGRCCPYGYRCTTGFRARAGSKKAVVAVAASMLKAAYHILRDGVEYKSLGPDHFTKLNSDRAKRKHIEALKRLGFEVELKAAS